MLDKANCLDLVLNLRSRLKVLVLCIFIEKKLLYFGRNRPTDISRLRLASNKECKKAIIFCVSSFLFVFKLGGWLQEADLRTLTGLEGEGGRFSQTSTE